MVLIASWSMSMAAIKFLSACSTVFATLETTRPDVHVDDTSSLATSLARRFEEEAERARARRGFCAVALPGGSVAAIFFPELARAQCDWARTAFFWGDERAVPPEDPESNYRVARELWLDPAGVSPANVHRMAADESDLDAAARSYETLLMRTLGTPPRLDIVLLGVGPDGHVCSLFPGHPLLAERARLVAPIEDAPKPPRRRLTLTLPVLWDAALVVVAALGDAKAAVLREALEEPTSPLPVALAMRGARRTVVLLDPASASLLTL
jgi:6-phosphogluconolactonase